MRKLLFSLLAIAALCGNALAQSVVLPGFPPGVFGDRGAIDAAPSGSPPAIDGTAVSSDGTTTATVTLTTAQSGDLIVVGITLNGSAIGLTIADTLSAGGSAWTCRTSSGVGTSPCPSTSGGIYEYYNCSASPLTADPIVITAASASFIEVIAWGVSGVGTCPASAFDGNASWPANASSGAITGLATSNAYDLVWGLARVPGTVTPPSGWTAIVAATYTQAFYKQFTSIQSGLTIPDLSDMNNGIVGDAAQN